MHIKNESAVLRRFAASRARVPFDVNNEAHVRAAINFFNPESPTSHRWLDSESGVEFFFQDELEYPSLPDMVREKLMFAHIRRVTNRPEIEDTYQILARLPAAQLLKYASDRPEVDYAQKSHAVKQYAKANGIQVIEATIPETNLDDLRGLPKANGGFSIGGLLSKHFFFGQQLSN